MTEPRIEKLFGCDSGRDKKFRRADVAEEVVKYFGDDFVDSAYYIRAGRILKEGIERGVIKKIGSARYVMINTTPSTLMERSMGESRKQFLEWWRHPEQEELRKSCAEGWGEKIWSASRATIEIELPAKNDISSDDNPIPDLVDWDDGRNAGIQECAEAIRAAGIKVKE